MLSKKDKHYQLGSPLNALKKRYGRGLVIQRKKSLKINYIQIKHTHLSSNSHPGHYSYNAIDYNQGNTHTNRDK